MNFNRRSRLFTASNLLSLSRVFLAIPIIYFLYKNTPSTNLTAVFFMLLAAFTDWLDGYFSRLFHQQSDLGRILDPLADKVVVGAITIYLTVERDFPLWFLLLILARDFVILALGFLMASRLRAVPESDWFGKVAVTGLAIVIIVYALEATAFQIPLLMVSVGLVGLTIFSYFDRFRKAMKDSNSKIAD
jgi:CDP-diacylglycerol--glycerol-3-phosphate 3-phosphatidyltransferase